MIFSEPIFLCIFLPVTYIVYRLLPKISLQNIWLAIASLVFFSFGQLPYTILLIISVIINYSFGLWLSNKDKARKLVVGLAVAINLIILGTFKYLDFIITIINNITGSAIPLMGIVLPIGISFYTFQGLSYVIDVYRNPKIGTNKFINILLYISFFPQLIAGPIVIYHDIAKQIENRKLIPYLTISGLQCFICGLAKKLLLADTMAVVVDNIYALNSTQLDTHLAWVGAICYILQLYFDFSGYSDMAIGLGRIFGFRFLENFNLPYTANSIKDFWRRWHISLSSWFRDYLYIPLGGNRKGDICTMRNKLIVFFATGLWHGANWTFVLWGLWHGLFLTLEDKCIIRRQKSIIGNIYTLIIVILGFVLFRSANISQAIDMFKAMLINFNISADGTLLLWDLFDYRTLSLFVISVLFALGIPQKLWNKITQPDFVLTISRAVGYSALFIICMLTMVSTSFSPFIYFQF